MLIALLGFLLSGLSWRESRRVDLSVGALQSYDGARFFSKGTVLEVTILNPSARIANLVRAEVRFRGRRLADVQYAVPDVNALSPVNRRDLVSASLHLPVSIPPGQAVIVGLVTTPRDIDVVNQLARAANPAYGTNPGARAAPFSWCHTVAYHNGKRVTPERPPSRRLKPAGELEVVMQFEPGGRRTARMVVTPSLAGTYVPADNRDVAPGWHIELDVAARHVQGLVVFKPMHDPPENARIKLWRGNGRRPQQTKIEPLYSDTACMDSGALHADRYRWSAEVGGRRIAAGRFRTPCTPVNDHPRQRQSVDPEVCQ